MCENSIFCDAKKLHEHFHKFIVQHLTNELNITHFNTTPTGLLKNKYTQKTIIKNNICPSSENRNHRPNFPANTRVNIFHIQWKVFQGIQNLIKNPHRILAVCLEVSTKLYISLIGKTLLKKSTMILLKIIINIIKKLKSGN